jgi:predicted ATPase/DNA-binding CsgD family transcriptional regulator
VAGVERSAAGTLHGFPVALTSFVGRDEALSGLAALLDEYRLVTVTGPGGAGKTRLAGEVALLVAGRFADGAWLAELAAVRDQAEVAGAVAAALGVVEQPGEAAVGALGRALARQQLLLVLDNCEHLIGAAAALCAGLLPACDELRILATSREPLRVAGEARFRLAPLSLPDPDRPAEGIEASEAVTLFAERARSADARFALDGETGPAVARLVARLDGMPLAIELAAARVEALGVAPMLDRIDDRFGLLVSGDRLAAVRHRSLEAAVEWSYELLDEPDRRVFRHLSAFPGPFTLEGAEAVAGPGGGPAALRLVDCSLLVPPQPGPDGRHRYVMLETLRAYGARLLAQAGEAGAAAAALARYALQVAEEAAEGLETITREAAAVRRLDAEDATVRQGLAWAADHDPDMMARLAVALGWWWLVRGRLARHVPLLRAAADAVAFGSELFCSLHIWIGQSLQYSADLTGSLEHFTLVHDAVGDLGPSRALAASLVGRSWVLLTFGQPAEAVDGAHRALIIAREVRYGAAEGLALVFLGLTAAIGGDRDEAVRFARRAQQVEAELPGAIARVIGHILDGVLIMAGDLAAAERACATALTRSRDVDDLWNLGGLLADMVVVDLRTGRVDDAAEHLREVLQIALRSGFDAEVLLALDCCGYLCEATGRFAEAVTVWAAFMALRDDQWADFRALLLPDRQGLLRRAGAVLGPDRARAAGERGAAMSRTTAAEYALMLTAGVPSSAAAGGLGRLSARERELVTLVAQGRTDAQIAAELVISARTVGSHLDRIRDKTGCRRRADLTRLALSAGLV